MKSNDKVYGPRMIRKKMNDTLMYLDTHLKSPKVLSIEFAYIHNIYHVDMYLRTGRHIHIENPTLDGAEVEIIEAYLGYAPDGV